jgi:hypothetical protein
VDQYKADDPFYEPVHTLFGTANLFLESIDKPSSHELTLRKESVEVGHLTVDLNPEDNLVTGRPFSFSITVRSAQVRHDWGKNVCVRYKLLNQQVTTDFANGEQVELNHKKL